MASEYDALLEEEPPPPPPPPEQASPYDALLTEQPSAQPIIPRSGAQMDSLAAREAAPALQAGVEAAAAAIPEAAEGAMKAQQIVMNPASVVSDALTPKPVKEFMEQQLVPTEAVDTARQAVQYPAQTLSNILFGTDFREQGALATAGKLASEQIAGQTTPENIALIAGTEGLGALEKGLAKKAPSLVEALFGGANREVAALTTETAKVVEPTVAKAVEPPPVPKELEIPKDSGAFPGISRGAEDVRREELNVQTEPVKAQGEPNASEITSPESVTQSEVRTPVGEGAPLRQQGETPEARQGVEAPVATEEKVAPTVPPAETTPVLEVTEKPLTQTADQPSVSGIANRITQERAAKGEIGEIAPGEGYSTQDLVQGGLKMKPEEVNGHVSDLMQGTGDPIKQAQAVRAEESRLSQRSAQLSRASESNPNNVEAKLAADNAFKDLTDFHNGPVARLKEVFHGTGMGLQGEIPVDLSTYNGLREAYFKDTGKLPDASMESSLRRTAERVSKAIEEDNGARTALSTEIEKQSASRKLPSADEVRNSIRERMGLEPCPT